MIQFILLQAGGDGSNPFISLAFFLSIFAVFYFFMMRPHAKRQKAQETLLNNLKEGQEVVTASGIIGRVVKVEGNVVRLLTDEKTFIKVAKISIQGEYSPKSGS
jgi:preprotein translocase subunit YajC